MSGPQGSNLINSVIQAAKKTFSRTRVRPDEGFYRLALQQDDFRHHLSQLCLLVSKVKSSDLGLERSRALNEKYETQRSLMKYLFPPKIRPPPVTYINIYENRDISVGVFIIRRGCKIPLHNHPGMHGILKVVHGSVDISSYTKVGLDQVRIPANLQTSFGMISKGELFPTRKESLKSGTQSETVLLFPDENNIHEIVASIDSPAAFIDVLAPPYNEHIEIIMDTRRNCHFYKELSQADDQIVWLEELEDSPEDYYCGSETFIEVESENNKQ